MPTELKKTFYSNGKLLLTGEYAVLDGAKALALPTRHGQHLDIAPSDGNVIRWTSLDANGALWLDEVIDMQSIINYEPGNSSSQKDTLINILRHAHEANPEVLNKSGGLHITTRLTFPRLWGLGSSSTLINNIAQWFGADPYELLAKSFGGSGYDIACASHDTPIIYRNGKGVPEVEPVTFNPPFADKLCFVYLNHKQDSREGIAAYRAKRHDIASIVPQIDTLTQAVLDAGSLEDFCRALEAHEELLSGILGMPTVKQSLFPDFPGTLKSLGAWGGDFILAASKENPEGYFRSRNFEVIVQYRDMILSCEKNPLT